MGHWAAQLLPEVKLRLGIEGNERDTELGEVIGRAQQRIELLAGRSFSDRGRQTYEFVLNGLPFAPIPDLRVASRENTGESWPIPDPVRPEHAVVLQAARFDTVFRDAMSVADALWLAGAVIASAVAEDRLTSAVGYWLDQERRAGRLNGVLE